MTNLVRIALITATPPTLVAIGALVASIRNGRKVEQLHVSVNSRMSQFMELLETSSEAKGVLKEHARKKIEEQHIAKGKQAEKDKCP